MSPTLSARAKILARLAVVGRTHSDATVLFHSTIAELMDLHPTDYKVLGLLDARGPMAAGEIARATGLATASVTNLIDRLELKQFARRTRDAKDRRRVVVESTFDRNKARDVFASTRKSLARLFARYSVQELTAIADFLERNGERLRAETVLLTGAG